ncbi:rhodanese-like domain-containing protein [Bacillus sp. sid0103]|uniref:rhodanese-like domain-containing protein n=1 Tax=Bacillus sp. sid0103 TaxID=2856337 RepID=UPI001C4961EA|nr:rhodanese-like domain-containing protein [Bacillus sp. sid0103]MBV7508360.1 rhodanese-like domain-containing protein [Bacillus sp. sid0103]
MTLKKITPKELHERLQAEEKTVLLDVRDKEKYNQFHIEESLNIPKTNIFELEGLAESKQLALPKDQEMIVTCTTGNSATKCAQILDAHHYNVKVLEGGLTAWKAYLSSLRDE